MPSTSTAIRYLQDGSLLTKRSWGARLINKKTWIRGHASQWIYFWSYTRGFGGAWLQEQNFLASRIWKHIQLFPEVPVSMRISKRSKVGVKPRLQKGPTRSDTVISRPDLISATPRFFASSNKPSLRKPLQSLSSASINFPCPWIATSCLRALNHLQSPFFACRILPRFQEHHNGCTTSSFSVRQHVQIELNIPNASL